MDKQLQNELEKVADEKRTIIFTSQMLCEVCNNTKALLNTYGKKYTEFDLMKEKELYNHYKKIHNHHTLPLIIYEGEYIGGYDDLTKYLSK